MALIGNMKGFLGANCSQRQDLRSRLNLVAAAEAHILWKTCLGHHVAGNMRESLDSSPLGQEGICQLGNWIRGAVLAPLCDPEVHHQLSEAHERFHSLGTQIIAKLKANDRREARALFEGEYTQSLRDIIQALTIINRCLYGN